MIKLNLTSYQAIQLDALLNSLSLLSSSVGHLVAPGFSSNSELKDIAENLRSELNSLVDPVCDWDKPENDPKNFKRLNIKAPPFWNDYDKYLLEGGKSEYIDWLFSQQAEAKKKREDVLYAFAVEEGNPSAEILNQYVLDYPEYVWDLVELFQELIKPFEDNEP